MCFKERTVSINVGEEISNSSLSQLSTLVAHVREKLTHVGFEELWIKRFGERLYFK